MTFEKLVQLCENTDLLVTKKLTTPADGIKFGKYTFAANVKEIECLKDIANIDKVLSPVTLKTLKQLEKFAGANWTDVCKFYLPRESSMSSMIWGTLKKDFTGNELEKPINVVYYRKQSFMGSTKVYSETHSVDVHKLLKAVEQKTPTNAQEVLTLAKALKKRLPEYESLLYHNLDLDSNLVTLIDYAVDVYAKTMRKLKKPARWPEAEKLLLSSDGLISDTPRNFVLYKVLGYAIDVIKGRWPEFEKILLKVADTDPYLIINYASYCIKNRWPEAEKILLSSNNKDMLVSYADNVIKGRWPEAEPSIASDANRSLDYARRVVHGRFVDGEPAIMSDENVKNMYIDYLNSINYSDDNSYGTEIE